MHASAVRITARIHSLWPYPTHGRTPVRRTYLRTTFDLYHSASYSGGTTHPKYLHAIMSFGFGVGDFLAVGKLVWGVYRAYADAPEQFRDFSQEILSLHIVIRQVEDELDISGSGGVPNLSTKAKNDLEILYDGLEGIMKELDDLLKKYQDLSENHSISFDRLKWGQEDLVRLRDKLRSNLTLLITFNSSLAKYVFIFPLYPLPYIIMAGIISVLLPRPKLIIGQYSAASSHSRKHNLSKCRSSLGSYLGPVVSTTEDQLPP